MCPKKFGSRKYLGLSKLNLGPKKILVQKNLGPNENWIPKKFESQKSLGPEKILIPKKFGSRTNFDPKIFEPKKILVPKILG